MFKVKDKISKEIVTVLDVYLDPVFPVTYFFIWENNGWRWRTADNYIPPNIEIKED